VKDVYRPLRARREIACTTVQTTVERLYEKGILAREGENRWAGYVYAPRLSRDELMTLAVKQVFTDLHATVSERQRVVKAAVA